jgi:hypothetical protein
VGLLTAKDGAPLRAGQAYADPFPKDRASAMINDAALFLKSGGQRGPQANVLTPGRYRLNHYLWDVDIVDAVQVPAGFVGVIKSNVHADVDFGTLKAAKPKIAMPASISKRPSFLSAVSVCGRSLSSRANIT